MSSTDPCELVAERIALGGSLGESSDHAASCVPCAALVATADRSGASRHPIDPGMGFTARMTVAAQQRITIRQRRRVAGAVITSATACVLGVIVMTRTPEPSETVATEPSPVAKLPAPAAPADDVQPDPSDVNDDLRALVRFSDVEHNKNISARWGRIQKPLKPYRALVKGIR